ncbi:unnamed protein product [Caenorhabditis auriculariae]|uniref:Uncharacterized protein n=1 Tax=Caenorhabditis auriculariae TaxID=2777116 RepID=A0A8S1GZG3_9PELO|nr:unnamed protein product [Caenorhabditis auriculariae]
MGIKDSERRVLFYTLPIFALLAIHVVSIPKAITWRMGLPESETALTKESFVAGSTLVCSVISLVSFILTLFKCSVKPEMFLFLCVSDMLLTVMAIFAFFFSESMDGRTVGAFLISAAPVGFFMIAFTAFRFAKSQSAGIEVSRAEDMHPNRKVSRKEEEGSKQSAPRSYTKRDEPQKSRRGGARQDDRDRDSEPRKTVRESPDRERMTRVPERMMIVGESPDQEKMTRVPERMMIVGESPDQEKMTRVTERMKIVGGSLDRKRKILDTEMTTIAGGIPDRKKRTLDEERMKIVGETPDRGRMILDPEMRTGEETTKTKKTVTAIVSATRTEAAEGVAVSKSLLMTDVVDPESTVSILIATKSVKLRIVKETVAAEEKTDLEVSTTIDASLRLRTTRENPATTEAANLVIPADSTFLLLLFVSSTFLYCSHSSNTINLAIFFPNCIVRRWNY